MSRRDENREETRGRILEAAHVLFAQRGLEDVTMADLADEAGVARATVFNHFPSKHAVVEAMTETVISFYQAMLDTALADHATPTPTLVRGLFEQMGEGIEADRRFYRGIFREIARVQLGLDEGSAGQRASEATLARIRQLVQRAQDRGEFAREHSSEVLASAFHSLSNGTITRWLYASTDDPLTPRMRAAADVLLAAVT
jgi:AcrR family transcriptional regulator